MDRSGLECVRAACIVQREVASATLQVQGRVLVPTGSQSMNQPRTMLENIDILKEDVEEDEEEVIAGVESADSSGSRSKDRSYRSPLPHAFLAFRFVSLNPKPSPRKRRCRRRSSQQRAPCGQCEA